jgi:hypothetical protein
MSEGSISEALVIKTSEPRWLENLARAYSGRIAVRLLDDAGIGIDPTRDTLFDMASRAKLAAREIAGVCVAVGMSAAGIAMILIAFFDPEPTSKLTLLVGGGVACVLGGGFSAIRILTSHKPPTIQFDGKVFTLHWT